MALSGYEKQKRWREKNRALYNFQQRERRKKGGDVSCPSSQSSNMNTDVTQMGRNAVPTVRPAGTVKELRALMERASAEPDVPAVKPLTYRDDYGRVITEGQWERLQKRKEEAKTNGYDIDEYSQF